MILARVLGNTVSTFKEPCFEGKKLLWVQPVDGKGAPAGEAFITIDAVGAGYGETVLVVKEGGSTMMICGVPLGSAPLQSCICAIVDEIEPC